jgi:3-oxoacyl-[acyl-carrier-protein] synthase-3
VQFRAGNNSNTRDKWIVIVSTFLRAVGFKLPDRIETNEDLVAGIPSWSAEKIFAKTGIMSRHILGDGQTPGDLAYALCEDLIRENDIDRNEIDLLILCTQSPDYFLPSTACLLQHQLGLPTACGAFDYNLGCSGFTYGLWIAQGMVASGQCRNVLIVTADAYSRYCRNVDIGIRCLFGDAAGAAIVGRQERGSLAKMIGSNVGTDGKGSEHLIVKHGGQRTTSSESFQSSLPCLSMNGPEVFAFTLRTVQSSVKELLAALDWSMESVDKFLLHQANAFMLEKLRDSMGLDASRVPIDLADTGNTVSSTLPILLTRCKEKGLLHPSKKYVLSGFGVGFSWCNTGVEWMIDSGSESRS